MGNKCKEDRAGLQCQSKLVVGEAQCGETTFEVEFLGSCIFTRYLIICFTIIVRLLKRYKVP